MRSSRTPPSGAPEGTVWFGGPVDRWTVSLRVFGDELEPDSISALLGCEPSSAACKGNPFPRTGRWILDLDSKDFRDDDDIDEGVTALLARLPSDSALWLSLTAAYRVDVFCCIFMAAPNRGFGISASTSKLLSDRNLSIGFDVYFDAAQPNC